MTPSRLLRAGGAVLVAAALTAAPRAAHAQLLKRLGKAVVEKAAEGAAGRAVRRDSSSTAAPDASSASSAPSAPSAVPNASAAVPNTTTRSPSTLAITPERVDAFVVAMKPLVAAAERRRPYEAAVARSEKYYACQARVRLGPPGTVSKAAEAEMDRIAQQVSAMTPRALAASQAGDTAAVNRLRDSTALLLDRQQALMYPAIRTTCGTYTPKPPAPNESAAEGAGAGAVAASGMTATQLGRLRERIALYLLSPAQATDVTGAERQAIDARRAELGPITAMFRDGSMLWSTWYDLNATTTTVHSARRH